MSTGAAIALGLVGVAAVGGVVWYVSSQKKKTAAAASSSSGGAKTTTDKVVGTITTALPIIGSIVALWS